MTPQRAKTSPGSTAGSFATHTRAEGTSELARDRSVADIVELLRPDLELLAEYDRGELAPTSGSAAAVAARALVEAVRRQPGHQGRVAGVRAAGDVLYPHGLSVAEQQLDLAAILVGGGGEEDELVDLVAALFGGARTTSGH